MESTKLFVDNKLQTFYSEASIFVPDKYQVYLYGPAVRGALSYLIRRANGMHRNGMKNPDALDLVAVKDFIANFFVDNPHNLYTRYWNNPTVNTRGAIALRWAAETANIPTMNPVVDSNKLPNLDPYKNIKLPYISDFNKESMVTISIVENEYFMWFQFFNALKLQFFNKKVLHPRDSLHKLSILFVPLINRINNDNNNHLDTTKNGYSQGQFYEFNSAFFKGIQNLSFGHDKTGLLKHSISFSCPTAFQQSFKHEQDGLRDYATDDTLFDFDKMEWRDSSHKGSNTINYNIGTMDGSKDINFSGTTGGNNVLKSRNGSLI